MISGINYFSIHQRNYVFEESFFSRADSNIYDIVENVQDWEVKKPLQLFFPTFIPLRLNEKTIILHAVFFLKPNKTSGEINHVETKITHAQSKKNKKKKTLIRLVSTSEKKNG